MKGSRSWVPEKSQQIYQKFFRGKDPYAAGVADIRHWFENYRYSIAIHYGSAGVAYIEALLKRAEAQERSWFFRIVRRLCGS